MILYHGSNIDIEEIDLQHSKPGKDFGRGFYLSDNESQAMQMANNTTEWAEFVLMNRKNSSYNPIHPYDIVIGPIANDRVGLQIRRFMLGDITVEQLVRELSYSKGLTIQYFFGTDTAIKLLEKKMTRSIEIQIEGLTSDLIRMVMETYGWDFARAMDEVYKSETFKRMCNPNTGMYYQSPVYVFDFLKNEIETGIMS